ncbi:hypothetical protein [Pseudomonas putida]|uniref:hypothetical protein n=1 Tax=Pseudomonas putida TaxID=303 RepID=UPI0009A14FEF|nr:hypothetical protein [Pseudomonas putida]
MNSPKEAFEKAHRARLEARKVRGKGAVIMIEPIIENPDDVLADKADNTVKASVLNDPNAELAIFIPKWINLPDPIDGQDNLNVFHTIGAFVEEIYAGTFDQSNADELPLRLMLDKAAEEYGADGAHHFYYEITSFYDGATYTSDPVTLIFDRIAPNHGRAPEAVPAVAEVIDGNVASVGILLPDYPDRAEKDVVYYYWLDSVPDDVEGITPAGQAEVTAAGQRLTVPEALIKSGGDGEWFVVYVLVDKAGNIGHVSKPTGVTVALGAMPANLKDPLVPLAADGLVDRLDAAQGVQVHVPQYDNWKATDEVSVSWAGSPLGRRTIGEGQTFPLVFSVSLEVLRREYGTPAQGTKEMAVGYEVLRGGKPRGNKSIAVDVNFETFGPVDPGPDPDPQWPDPVNPQLPLCDVFGDGSSQPNMLLPAHDGKDATLKVELYEGLAKDDLVEFFWGGTLITEASYTVKAADKAGDPLVRPIPWPYIHQTGNGAVAVHYQLTRVGVPNKPTSADQQVAVSAIVVHPDEPEFQGVGANGWLSCQALKDPDDLLLPAAIRIKVGDLSQYGLKDDDQVTMHWKLLHAQTGDEEVLTWEQEITLGTAYPVSGFTWRVEPYDDYILPLYEFDVDEHKGRAFCWYTFQDPARRNQGLDALIISDIAEQKIAMENPFGPCPVFFNR